VKKAEHEKRATAESKRKVHIIDDDPSVRRGLKRLMGAYGYEGCAFACAREFLAAGPPGDDSCLIIDVAMPDMDGLQLLEELTRLGCKAPVIFITALDDPDIRQRATRAGVVAFFRKPVDADELLDAVKKGARDGGRGGNAERGILKEE